MRYMLGVLFIILVSVLTIVLLVSHSTNGPQTKSKQVMKLSDYNDTNSSVSYLTEGEIVGQDQFTSIRITVSATQRKAEILKGYEFSVERSDQFSNTKEAYNNFLSALGTGNFLLTRKSSFPSEEGVCPLGRRYVYELVSDQKSVQRTWGVSCSSGVGTFAGSNSTVNALFQNQITDYDKFVSGVIL